MFVLPGARPGAFSSMVCGVRGTVVSGRADPSASRPARPNSAPPPRHAPPRPDPICSGFGFDKSG